MIKYRLRKNLPCVKAGEIFREDFDENNIVYLYQESYGIKQHKICLEDIDNFDEWFEEVNKKKFGIYAVSAEVIEVSEELYTDSGIDNLNKLGAWFDTKEEAEKYLEYQKAKTIIKQDTNGFNPDWSNKQQYKYYGYWDLREHKPIWNVSNMAKTVNIYFESRKLLEESFEKHSKEWKTYLTYEQQ